MSQQSNDGGSAFPHARVYGIRDDEGRGKLVGIDTETITGLSIRDYFAAKAMQALVSVHSVATPEHSELLRKARGSLTFEQWVSAAAYCQADAMLAARDPKQPV